MEVQKKVPIAFFLSEVIINIINNQLNFSQVFFEQSKTIII